MSFEAVPCMFRSVQGPNGDTEYLGLLIRPAPPGTQLNGPPPQPLRVQGVYKSGAPITVSGEHAPKLLVPANVQVRMANSNEGTVSSTQLAISWHRSGSPPVLVAPSTSANDVSPVSGQNRSASVCSSSPLADSSSPMSPAPTLCSMSSVPGQFKNQTDSRAHGRSSRQWPGSNVSDSSTTPDSGIQSIPNSPPGVQTMSPPNIEACSSVCEELPDDEEDYADMPHLVPADEEEECAPGTSGIRDDSMSTNGSECETAVAPSISITHTMDSTEIVEQLLQLDPEKASAIARLIRIKTQEQKRKSSETRGETPKRGRPNSSASDELKKSDEEGKRDSSKSSTRKRSKSPEPQGLEMYNNYSPEELRKRYRDAVKRILNDKLAILMEKTRSAMEDLRIGERERRDRRGNSKEPRVFFVNWDNIKRRQKRVEEKKKKVERKRPNSAVGRHKKDSESSVKEKRRKTLPSGTELSYAKESKSSRPPARTPSKRRSEDIHSDEQPSSEKKKDQDYEDIKRSYCSSNLTWSSPIVHCGCSRGACTSDAECINRALCVQCPQSCHTSLCVNKKFWREDVVRHLTATNCRGKRILKTRQTRRAGEFLGEYAGEVVLYKEAINRIDAYQTENIQPCILALSATLFIDATRKGNITRFVRHSCRPNTRLEVWSINGKRRAGLFSLYDISSGSEITIDMNHLVPQEFSCACSPTICSGVVKRSRNCVLASANDISLIEEQKVRKNNIFLIRNRTKTIKYSKRIFVSSSSTVPNALHEKLSYVLEGLEQRVRRIDGSIPYKALKEYNLLKQLLRETKAGHAKDDVVETFNSIVDRWLERLNDDDYDRVFHALSHHYLTIPNSADSKSDKKSYARARNREVNLSYLEVGEPVGSYDPDAAWPTGPAKEGDDAVRCDCGSLEEDGQMMQCDVCHYWLHTDCIGTIDDSSDYQCKFCSGAIKDIPSTDVLLAKQPEIRLLGCTYHKALNNNRNIQVRLNETVYVAKDTGEEHKKVLKFLVETGGKGVKKKEKEALYLNLNSNEEYKSIEPPSFDPIPHTLYDRKHLRAFRVERLFVAPTGHRFVFGFYYARPHETICDPNRIFHRNEVFATRFYDTLPIDAVVGRCVVLDADVWIKGRPLFPRFKEEDVFICEYQIDRQQRSFEKVPPRNRFPFNTQPYAFEDFPEPKNVIRDFTPFIVNERGPSSANGRISRSDSSKGDQILRKIAEGRIDSVTSKLNANLSSRSEKRKKKEFR